MKLSGTILDKGGSPSQGGTSRSGSDRRREPRTLFGGEATIIPCNASDRTPIVVQIRDVSASGLGITHTAPLAKGERFIAVLPVEVARIARGILCTVVYSTASAGGRFHIGARFESLLKPATANPSTAIALGSPVAATEHVIPAAQPSVAPATPDHTKAVTASKPHASGSIPRLLTRDECIERAQKAMQARTLSGVVAQVIAMAASPRSAMSDLASLVARDPMLSARILQAANSVSYASTRGMVSTIPEAVRNIGCGAVRDIASSLGVFDAMPPSSPDGFNPIRCWQHSFAVATLCQQLAGNAESGLAYLVGLCHDLGEILFQTHFGSEYRQLLALQEAIGGRRDELERKMFGMTHGELVVTILRCLGLPDAIRAPIETFHETRSAVRSTGDMATRQLRLADSYANGLLLPSSVQSPLMPLTRVECRSATGTEQPPCPDGVSLRSEIFALTAMLARLSSKDEATLLAPLYPHRDVRVWLTRDSTLSSFDPIGVALEALAQVTVADRLPAAAELADHQGIVITSRTTSGAGCCASELSKMLAEGATTPTQVLWLAGRIDGAVSCPAVPSLWPIPICTLADFVARL